MIRKLSIALGAILLTLALFGIASAHAKLDHCTPAVSSTVGSALTQVVCVYSEEIDTKLSTISVWNASGVQVDKQDGHVDLNDPDHKTLVVSLDTVNTPSGLYTVKWHAVTPDDGGISDGTWQFVVGSANATPYPPTEVVAGETPGAGTPAPVAQASTAAPASTTTTAAPAAAVTSTSTTPSTVPTTGGVNSVLLVLVALLGALLVAGGVAIRARRLGRSDR